MDCILPLVLQINMADYEKPYQARKLKGIYDFLSLGGVFDWIPGERWKELPPIWKQ